MLDENEIPQWDKNSMRIEELQSAILALQGQIADIMEILTELVNNL